MKKELLSALAIAATALCASAQSYFTEPTNPDMIHHSDRVPAESRREFIIPATVGGFIPVKTDLHLHTFFSDGEVAPATRVREAWLDGLDAIAVTEHIEYHPHDKAMRAYLNRTATFATATKEQKEKKAKKTTTATKAKEYNQDHNFSVQQAQKAAPAYGMLIIPGTEVTREAVNVGHYNALFTTDNNLIYDEDPLQALRNAKAQGALVMHNHPGWRRTSINHPEFEVKAYGEGLIDGIEAINGSAFCPGTIDRARDKNLFVAGTTDLHRTSAETYSTRNLQRDMTIVLATEKSLPAIREALEKRRTIAFGAGGSLCGQEPLLRELLLSSVKATATPSGALQLSNPTSLRFTFLTDGGTPVTLFPFSSILVTPAADGTYTATLTNMWTGANAHPTFTLRP